MIRLMKPTVRKFGIKNLRSLGGQWVAICTGFASYQYEGKVNGKHYLVHRRTTVVADDDIFETRWYIYENGIILSCQPSEPDSWLSYHLAGYFE